MANDPCTLAFGFTSLEFLDQVLQDAGLIWICEVEEIKDVVDIPEIGVDGYNSETLSSGVGVGSIVGGRMVRFCCSDPAISLPHGAEEVVVPAEDIVCASCLLTIDVVGGVVGLWQRVVIAQSWIDGNVAHFSFEDLVSYSLLVLNVCSAQLVIILTK